MTPVSAGSSAATSPAGRSSARSPRERQRPQSRAQHPVGIEFPGLGGAGRALAAASLRRTAVSAPIPGANAPARAFRAIGDAGP